MLGAVAIRCRRAEAVPCRAATSLQGYGSPARGSSGGGGSLLLLLPSFASSPLLAAAVEGETPGALGFRGDSRGVYLGGALGFWPGHQKGTAVMGQTWRGMRGSIRVAPWLGFSSARWSESACGGQGRQLRQAVASAAPGTGGRRARAASRRGTACGGEKAEERGWL